MVKTFLQRIFSAWVSVMFFSRLLILISVLMLSACDDMLDDLNPSAEDLRPDVVPGSSGTYVDQQAINFTLTDTLNVDVTLTNEYPLVDAVVLYFTMWCPVCDSHMSYMRNYVVPNYPNVKFYFVDYVSGSVSSSRQAQLSNGYTDFDVLVDADNVVQEIYSATMGTVVVVDNSGIVKMNEDFKDGSKLNTVLNLLP